MRTSKRDERLRDLQNAGSLSAKLRIKYSWFDGAGNVTKEDTFDPAGVLARTRSRVFDSLNRMAQEVGALAQTTTHGYDGNGNRNRLTTTDSLNRLTTNTYDALNRLLTVTDPAIGVTSYAHDNAGNLAGVTDPRDLTTTYGHDGLGNPVSQVSPDTGITTRTFDAAGNGESRVRLDFPSHQPNSRV